MHTIVCLLYAQSSVAAIVQDYFTLSATPKGYSRVDFTEIYYKNTPQSSPSPRAGRP